MRIRNWVAGIVSALVLSGLIATYVIWRAANTSRESAERTAGGAAEARTDRIVLPPEKFAAADLQCVTVARRPLQPIRLTPGRLDYNGLKRVELKAPVDAVIRDVLAKPGDAVRPGTRLAVLDSPEIGVARADLEHRRAEARIDEHAFEFAELLTDNLGDLLRTLKGKPRPEAVEKLFEEKVLGDHRVKIMAAYSKYVLADQLWQDIQPFVEKGSVSQQTVKQRETSRQVARDEYVAVCEQSQFDARQHRDKARIARDDARRALAISRQKLRTILGAHSEVTEADDSTAEDEKELSRFYLVAPFAGTIEERSAAAEQRVSVGTMLFSVADTATLWVNADVRERDWQALSLKEGDALSVRVPALADREFSARVEFVGRAVDHETQAVPLVAELDNAKQLLRPGMFVWVTLPAGPAEESLVVPSAAVLTHEGAKFVFVEDGPRAFRRIDVTTGLQTPQGTAILAGLKENQRVVAQGAFLLKSELLLEPEED